MLGVKTRLLAAAEGTALVLTARVAKMEAETKLRELEMTKMKKKAERAEALRARSRESFRTVIAKRRKEADSLQRGLDTALRQLDLLAVGRKHKEVLIKEAVDTAEAELGTKHAGELKVRCSTSSSSFLVVVFRPTTTTRG